MEVKGGLLYAVGGDLCKDYISIEKWDDCSSAWKDVTELAEERNGCSIAALGSKIYIFGGGSEASGFRTTWNAYDVNIGQWASASPEAASGPSRTLPSAVFYNGSALTVPPSRAVWNEKR